MSTDHTEYALVIDLGTGGPKVGLVDQKGRVAACAGATVQTFFLPGGAAEHDPAEWWSSIKTCTQQVLKESGISPKNIRTLAVTSCWSVTVAVDERGEPLMNALSWMDLRGARYNAEIVKGFPSVMGYQVFTLLKYLNKHGFPPSPTSAGGHALFIKHERPEVYQRTYKFFEPMDYINMRLTGKFAATQNTMLPMLVVDNRRLDRTQYDPWMVKMSGIDPAKLPDLLPIDGILGNLTPAAAVELGLSQDTVVVCGVSDHSISAIGAGSIGVSEEPAAVMGSSGHMAFHVPHKKSGMLNMMCTIPGGLRDRYVFWSDLGNNGKVLDTCLKNLLGASDSLGSEAVPADWYERADRMAAPIPPGSAGVLFLPWFSGSFSPEGDAYLRGGFLNLSHSTSRAHLMRAVFEGLAMNWRWLRGPAEKLAGRKFNYWRITGGGALSDVWVQIMADVVGIPMHRVDRPRMSTMIGMGLLAFNRMGKVRLEDIPGMIKFDRIFEPDPNNRPLYDRMYARWSEIRDKIRPVMHALNKQ